MTILINSGGQLLLFFGIIFAAVVLSMLLKKGERQKKMLALVIIIVVFIFVFFMFGRPSRLTIDENGIRATSYSKISFGWHEVKRALIIENYEDTGYKPTLRLKGSTVKGFRIGSFRLSNGEKVKLITQKNSDAAVFYTGDKVYLLAVDELPALIDAAEKYIIFEQSAIE